MTWLSIIEGNEIENSEVLNANLRTKQIYFVRINKLSMLLQKCNI